jgi:tight adherence protein G
MNSAIGRRNQSTPQSQKGVAAVWMALTMVPVLGMTFWAVEGTRYIQDTNRLRDAAQAAASAVTIADKSLTADEFASLYIRDYIHGENSANVEATRFYQEFDPSIDQQEIIQYTVDATTNHSSWFANNLIPSFDTTQDLKGQAMARKLPFYLGDKNIDLVLVTDFSGSMGWQWGSRNACSASSCKIEDLKDAVADLTDKLLCSEVETDASTGEETCVDEDQATLADKLGNRVAIVPFNVRTRETNGSNVFAVSQLRYRDDVDESDSPRSYEQVSWNKWRQYSSGDVYDCAQDRDDCPNGRNGERYQAQRLVSIFDIDSDDDDDSFLVDVYNYVDFDLTVEEMLTSTFPDAKTKYRLNNMELYRGYGSTTENQFYTIGLTRNRADIDVIEDMWASGNTASFQGMIRGFQHMASGRPDTEDEEELTEYSDKIKMVLVLSDGVESPNNGILKGLVDAGMCDKAREEIPGLYIAVIGIDFAASEQSGFQDCVLNIDEDIVDVTDTDEFIEKIEELIRKGSRGTGETRLYG